MELRTISGQDQAIFSASSFELLELVFIAFERNMNVGYGPECHLTSGRRVVPASAIAVSQAQVAFGISSYGS